MSRSALLEIEAMFLIYFQFLLLAAFVFIFGSSTDSSSLCNPSTKKLFGKFLLKRWLDARSELKMSNDWKIFGEKKTYMERSNSTFVLIHFYSFNPGAVVYVTPKKVAVPFVRMLTKESVQT